MKVVCVCGGGGGGGGGDSPGCSGTVDNYVTAANKRVHACMYM